MKVALILVLVLLAIPPTSVASAGYGLPARSDHPLDQGNPNNFVAKGSTQGAAFATDSSGAFDSLPQGQNSSWSGQSYGIWVAAYSEYEVQEVIHNLSGYLHSGDGVAIVLHPGGFSALNREANETHAALPGVLLRAYTSLDGGTNHPGGLSRTISKFSPLFSQLSADYEVNGPLEFSANYTRALNYFTNFSAIVRSAGFQPIAYPSGRSVLGGQYGWNYGGFANVTSGQTIETQAYCGTPWRTAVSKIWSEYNTTHVSLRTLSLQISIGRGCSEWQIIHAAKFWRQLTHGNIFFWWGPHQIRELTNILRQVEH